MEIITGHDLCDKVLSHPDGGVEALIDLAGGQETDWLEFKAAPWPIGNIEKGLNQADYHWHIAKAVLAMANSRGGCVLVGISEPNLEPVDLQKNDPRELLANKGSDAFLRYIRRAIEPDSGIWKCQKAGYWKLNGSLSPLLRLSLFPYRGCVIVAILVNPLPHGASLLTVRRHETEHSTLFFRRQGHFGEIGSHSEKDNQADWENHRAVSGSDLSALWQYFLKNIGAEPLFESSPEGLEDRIQAYHASVRRLSWYKEVVRSFTDLECLERTIEVNETEEDSLDLSPCLGLDSEAQEWLEDGFDLDDINDDKHSFHSEQASEIELTQKKHSDLNTIMIETAPRREPRQGMLFDLLREETRSLVAGDPGSGKSTSLRRLLLQSIRDYNKSKEVKIYVPLASYTGNLTQIISKLTMLTRNDIYYLIRMKRLNILFDALNECKDELQERCVSQMQQFLYDNPTLPVILSTRTQHERGQLNIPVFIIQPLSNERRILFLSAHLSCDETQAKFIIEKIHMQPGGERLTENPLLLRLIIGSLKAKEEIAAGRARLYKQLIYRWYKREINKPSFLSLTNEWQFDEVIKGLAHIAFHTRKSGQSFCTTEQATNWLSFVINRPKEFIFRFERGLLYAINDDQIMFLHETFQEYLAAEYLARNPKALEGMNHEDYYRWSMVIAYSLELSDSIPKAIKDAAEAMNPWIGALLDAKNQYHDSTGWVDVLRDKKPPKNFLFTNTNHKQYPTSDPGLQYLYEINLFYRKKWTKLEFNILEKANLPKFACYWAKNALQNKTDILTLKHEKNKFLSSKTIKNNKKTWIRHASFSQAATLIEKKLCLANNFSTRKEEWLKKLTLWHYKKMIDLSICTNQEVKEKIISSLKIIITINDKKSAIDNFINLINNNMLSQEEIENELLNFNPYHLEKLLNATFFSKKFNKLYKNKWINESTPVDAHIMISKKICTAKEFLNQKERLSSCSSPNDALLMIKSGICVKNNFFMRKNDWIKNATLEKAIFLINNKLCTRDDFDAKKKEWISKASIEDAINLIDEKLCRKTDFDEKKREWMSSSTPHTYKKLIKFKFFTENDFNYKKRQWVETATPEQIYKWHSSQILTYKDISPQQSYLLKIFEKKINEYTNTKSLSQKMHYKN